MRYISGLYLGLWQYFSRNFGDLTPALVYCVVIVVLRLLDFFEVCIWRILLIGYFELLRVAVGVIYCGDLAPVFQCYVRSQLRLFFFKLALVYFARRIFYVAS